jgi:hypothetical protein
MSPAQQILDAWRTRNVDPAAAVDECDDAEDHSEAPASDAPGASTTTRQEDQTGTEVRALQAEVEPEAPSASPTGPAEDRSTTAGSATLATPTPAPAMTAADLAAPSVLATSTPTRRAQPPPPIVTTPRASLSSSSSLAPWQVSLPPSPSPGATATVVSASAPALRVRSDTLGSGATLDVPSLVSVDTSDEGGPSSAGGPLTPLPHDFSGPNDASIPIVVVSGSKSADAAVAMLGTVSEEDVAEDSPAAAVGAGLRPSSSLPSLGAKAPAAGLTVPQPTSGPARKPSIFRAIKRGLTVSDAARRTSVAVPSGSPRSSPRRRSTLGSQPDTDATSAPRVAVQPQMYTLGAISHQTRQIEDEESRRLSEVAFM